MNVDLQPGSWWFANVRAADPGIGRPEYDGDTVYLDVDLGYGVKRPASRRLSFRLLHINAPELKPLATRALALVSRDALDSVIRDRPLIIRTELDPDDFGRALCEIYWPNGFYVNQWMVESGHAVPYKPNGGTP